MFMRMLFVLLFLIPVSHASDKILSDSLSALKRTDKSLIIIDARRSSDYRSSHIPSSVNWPSNKSNPLHFKIEHLNKAKTVVLYGDLSSLSHMLEVRSFIESSGCCEVFFLYRGLFGWLSDGYSVSSISGIKPYEPRYIQEENLQKNNDVYTLISVLDKSPSGNSNVLNYRDYLGENGLEFSKLLRAIKAIEDQSTVGRWVVFDQDIENVHTLVMKLANLGIGSSVLLK